MQSPSIKRIACVGEVMVELVPGDNNSARLGIAGDTYNTAVYLKRLLQDCDISYVTALGTDRFSSRILEAVNGHGLNPTHIEQFSDKMPGLYTIETDESGERSFAYWRSESAARSLFSDRAKMKVDALGEYDLVYLSGISMAILPSATRKKIINFLNSFCASGGRVAFDSNYRPRLWEDQQTAREITSAMWSLSDIALPSLDDEMALFGDKGESEVLNRLQTSGVKFGALKRGAAGPVAICPDKVQDTYTKVTEIIDTTAAGDSFNAGFLAAHAQREDIAAAMKAGHDLASRVIQHKGAIINL